MIALPSFLLPDVIAYGDLAGPAKERGTCRICGAGGYVGEPCSGCARRSAEASAEAQLERYRQEAAEQRAVEAMLKAPGRLQLDKPWSARAAGWTVEGGALRVPPGTWSAWQFNEALRQFDGELT